MKDLILDQLLREVEQLLYFTQEGTELQKHLMDAQRSLHDARHTCDTGIYWGDEARPRSIFLGRLGEVIA